MGNPQQKLFVNEIDNITKNKILTKIYKMIENNYGTRKTREEIKKRYDIVIREKEIFKVFPSHKFKNKRNKYTNTDKSIILNLYKNYYNTDKVRLYLKLYKNINITESALATLASRNNIKKKFYNIYSHYTLNYKEEKELVKLYINGASSKDLCKKYGFKTYKSVQDKVIKHGYSPSEINQKEIDAAKTYSDFSMEKINSKEKGYFLGLMLTDGCLHLNSNQIELSLTDEDCIKYVSNYIIKNYNTYKRADSLPIHRIVLNDKKIYNQLLNKGLTPRKTYDLKGPKLTLSEKRFIPDILRGIIDGDGWVRKDGKEFYICSASNDFLLWCKKSLESLGMIDLSIKHVGDPMYVLRTAIKENINILKNVIYKENYGMKRKRNRIYKE